MKAVLTSSAMLAIALTCSQPAPAQTNACSLTGLGWMAASWASEKDPQGSRETWVTAPGGILMGSAFEFPTGHAGYAELMTIRATDEVVSMILRHFDGTLSKAWEPRETPMVFNATVCDGSSATFEGQGEHVGERMTYRRTGTQLLIVADFLHGGKPDHEEWRMVAITEH